MKNDRKFIVTLALIALGLIAIIFGAQSFSDNASKQSAIEKINKNALPQLDSNVSDDESLIVMHTTNGDIKIKLFNKYAPLAVENFLTHAKDGYYNGTNFHRVIEDFMIQGGDPAGDGTGGQSIWKDVDASIDNGYGFKNEVNSNLFNIRGALSMANTDSQDNPNSGSTNGSQFFIVQNSKDASAGLDPTIYPKKIIEAYKKGGYPSLDGKYTVFGQVLEGMDVVDSIAKAKKVDDGQNSTPVNPVVINSIEILQEAKNENRSSFSQSAISR